MGGSDSKHCERPPSIEEFHKLSEKIRSSFQKIESTVTSLKQILNQIDPINQDVDKLKSELHPIENCTNKLIENTQEQLKSLGIPEKSNGLKIKQGLATDFKNILDIYVKVQNEIKEKIQTCLEVKRLKAEHEEKMYKIETKMALLRYLNENETDADETVNILNSLLHFHRRLLEFNADYEQLSIDERRAVSGLEDDILETSEVFYDAYGLF